MAKIYYDKDCDLKYLSGKKVAILGYGSQGHAHSQNLRDSGVEVIVAEYPGGAAWKKAEQAGFKVMTADEASKIGDVIVFTLPDTIQSGIYEKSVKANLTKGNVLLFAHGFNIRFNQIVPPDFIDVIMVAPKGPGHLVRSEFMEGRGVPNLIAVEQNASGNAKNIAMAYSKGIGGSRAGIIETTFTEETETDLFGEQAILCGGVTALMRAGFETLVEAGYQPEIAYFECIHEMKLIVDLIYEGGMEWMWYSVSDTAEYGGLTVGSKMVTDETKKSMKQVLERIQNGEFASEWLSETRVGQPKFKSLRNIEKNKLNEKVGAELRKMMPWLSKRKTETGGK
ncbi:MAG TPA: ketol-acid reductoisomerase [bacterium]|nr:ketol-acid reductoisomerase [bacterium]HPN30592.1 ketol-acid reductoisomerase [bacterium]